MSDLNYVRGTVTEIMFRVQSLFCMRVYASSVRGRKCMCMHTYV